MQPLKARVRNGRLVLDEPTDLPEGEVVELVPLDATPIHPAAPKAAHAVLLATLVMSAACNNCPPLPCPGPGGGFDQSTCSCRGVEIQDAPNDDGTPVDAGADATIEDGG